MPRSTPIGAPAPNLTRRRFLAWGSAGAAAVTAGGLTTKLAFATPGNPAVGDVLVVVFLRGGADGMSLIPPYGDADYYALRPGIAVPRPGQAGGALDLNGFFGMHPAMRALYEGPWAKGDLAIVNATGWPREITTTRSHFEAQDYWERSSTDVLVHTGWVARHLASLGSEVGGAAPAVGKGSTLQASLRGYTGAISASRLNQFAIQGFSGSELPRVRQALGELYGAAPPPVGPAGASLLAALGSVAQAATIPTQNGVTYPNTDLGTNLREIAQLTRANVGLRAAAVDVGGWDMHDDMGTSTAGAMAARAGMLGDALAAFAADLGAQGDEVTTVVMTEFGRTSKENGSGGTDHGRGNVMFVLGGLVRGGLYGQWPMIVEDRDPDRDLSVTTDFRTALGEVLTNRLGNPAVGTVFPGFTPPATPLGLAPVAVAAG